MHPDSHNPHHERRWLILAVLGLAQLMVILDATIVNIALPSAQHGLHFSNDLRQWVITAYALSFGSLLLLGGRLSDLFGRKRTLIIGLLGFAGASALGGSAQSIGVLIGARALQGAFGALLAPSVLSLLTTTFTDARERGRAFAIYGAIAGAGGALGLLFGGVLTEYFSWRACLYVNLAFAVPATVGALTLVHNQPRSTGVRLDLPGALTASGGLLATVYGLTKAQTDGWGAPVTIGLLAAGALLLVVFTAIQRRSQSPLLPLRIVADRNRGGAYLSVGLAAAGMFGVFLFLTYYLQQNLGLSPVQTGLAFLPMTLVISVAAAIAQTRLLPRTGPKPLVIAGMLLAAGGMVMLAQLGVHSTYAADILPGLLVLAAGLGLTMATGMNTATFGVRPADAGAASAMVNTSQQIGGSIGTALLSTLAASATSAMLHGAPPSPAMMSAAAVHGYTTAFWFSAAIFTFGAVVGGLLLRPGVNRLDAAPAPVLAH
ncbi:MAG TPA: MFS transporter [Solirubrobacteraceae bacterium]|nr:MFS transporter [Solirubrobacteraceae bacterium]